LIRLDQEAEVVLRDRLRFGKALFDLVQPFNVHGLRKASGFDGMASQQPSVLHELAQTILESGRSHFVRLHQLRPRTRR
jgi:hypothetical protein